MERDPNEYRDTMKRRYDAAARQVSEAAEAEARQRLAVEAAARSLKLVEGFWLGTERGLVLVDGAGAEQPLPGELAGRRVDRLTTGFDPDARTLALFGRLDDQPSVYSELMPTVREVARDDEGLEDAYVNHQGDVYVVDGGGEVALHRDLSRGERSVLGSVPAGGAKRVTAGAADGIVHVATTDKLVLNVAAGGSDYNHPSGVPVDLAIDDHNARLLWLDDTGDLRTTARKNDDDPVLTGITAFAIDSSTRRLYAAGQHPAPRPVVIGPREVAIRLAPPTTGDPDGIEGIRSAHLVGAVWRGTRGNVMDAAFAESGLGANREVLAFDGKHAYADLGPLQLDLAAGLTIEALVRVEAANDGQRLFEASNGGGSHEIALGFDGTSLQPVLAVNLDPAQASMVLKAEAALPLGTWTHLVAVLDPSGEGRLYVNGSLVVRGQVGTPLAAVRSYAYLGRSVQAGKKNFAGELALLHVWTEAFPELRVAVMATGLDASSPLPRRRTGIDPMRDRSVVAVPAGDAVFTLSAPLPGAVGITGLARAALKGASWVTPAGTAEELWVNSGIPATQKVLAFANPHDRVELGALRLDLSTGWTFEMLLRPEGLAPNRMLLSMRGDRGAGIDLVLDEAGTHLVLATCPPGGSPVLVRSRAELRDRAWVHLAVVAEADRTVRIFVNAEVVGEGTVADLGTQTFMLAAIGRTTAGDDVSVRGTIARAQLWTKPFTAGMIGTFTKQWPGTDVQAMTGARAVPADTVAVGWGDRVCRLQPPTMSSPSGIEGLASARLVGPAWRPSSHRVRSDALDVGGIPPGQDVLGFDGADDHVDLGKLDLDGSHGLSFEVVLRVETARNYCRVVELSNGAGRDNIIFGFRGRSPRPFLACVPGDRSDLGHHVVASEELELGTWTHLAATFDQDGTGRIFVNGRQVAEGSSGSPGNAVRSQCWIGRSAWPGDEYFQGEMALFQMFTLAMPAEAAARLYTGVTQSSSPVTRRRPQRDAPDPRTWITSYNLDADLPPVPLFSVNGTVRSMAVKSQAEQKRLADRWAATR